MPDVMVHYTMGVLRAREVTETPREEQSGRVGGDHVGY